MRRSWSIRARTTLAFALTAMALTAAVLVFVNLTSQHAFSVTVEGSSTRAVTAVPVGPGDVDDADRAPVRLVQESAELRWQWSAVGIVVAGLLAGVLGWFVSRRMLRPIDRITAAATRISASNLHERIDLGGPDDELRRLARTVDDLLDRLETAFESQRRFVAQASHELRTPLAVQRVAMQIGLHDDAGPDELRATRDELLDQNRRTEHLVESLLVLAEADRGLDRASEDVDVGAVVDRSVSGVAGAAATAGVTVVHERRTVPPGPVVRGEPTLVGQLLANLVGNAVEYNHEGGFVRVVTEATGFVVENSGPVVPVDVAPLLTEPFRRCPSDTGDTSKHSGLGLSIVASIVRAHGWSLTVVPRPGGGLRVRVDVSSV